MDTITSKLEDSHKDWLNQIRSWERELNEMEEVNGQIVEKIDNKEGQKKVEHFQNQILIQKQRLDQMKHNIKIYGGNLEKGQKELEDYRGYYDEFRSEFNGFTGQFE
jgi:predicted  nucleic acid-binding Zn-ribbon protein